MKYSTIIFEIKKKLGVTLREYVFLDTVYHLQVKTGASYAKNEYYGELLDILPREVQRIKAKMIGLGLLHTDGEGVKTSDLWNSVYLGTDELKKPKKEKREATFTVLGADIIKALEAVDPKNKLYYGNRTQREACDFLIEEYSFETVISAIEFYKRAKGKVRFLPTISTPCELRDKWSKLYGILERQNAENMEAINNVVQ